MSGDATVRRAVLEAIRSGKLPDCSPEHTWAGPGCGKACVICSHPATADQLEYEVVFVTGDDKRLANYNAHVACFVTWELERRKLRFNQGTSTAGELSDVGADITVTDDDWETQESRGRT